MRQSPKPDAEWAPSFAADRVASDSGAPGQAVTIRGRDMMKQEQVGLDAVVGYLSERLVAR
jgi:glycyl-tRNA synthetase (class II)